MTKIVRSISKIRALSVFESAYAWPNSNESLQILLENVLNRYTAFLSFNWERANALLRTCRISIVTPLLNTHEREKNANSTQCFTTQVFSLISLISKISNHRFVVFLLLESVVFVSPESEMKQQEKNVCMSRGATTANKREKKKTTDRKL